jgi:Phage integrase family
MLDFTHPARHSSTNHFSRGGGPANKGRRYPADPPRVEEIVAVMRQAGTDRYGHRLRGLIVVLWRAGLRISEALALTESDLEITRGSVLVRRGKGGRRREVGMDECLGSASPLARDPGVAAGRTALLRDQRTNLWPIVVKLPGPNRAATHRGPGGGPSSLCPTPAASRSCG